MINLVNPVKPAFDNWRSGRL